MRLLEKITDHLPVMFVGAAIFLLALSAIDAKGDDGPTPTATQMEQANQVGLFLARMFPCGFDTSNDGLVHRQGANIVDTSEPYMVRQKTSQTVAIEAELAEMKHGEVTDICHGMRPVYEALQWTLPR